jgi:hypothetical protein
MRSRQPGHLTRRLAAGLLAILAALNIAWAPAIPEGKPLTAEQEASIREEMTSLAGVLISGGATPQDAKLATHAVGTCIGVAYSYDLSRQQAERVCGEVLDAFIIQPGTVAYKLTPDDRAWLESKIQGWTDELAMFLGPDELMAVQSTMSACLTGHMERGESRSDAIRSCAVGLMPFRDVPGLRERLTALSGARP